VAHWVRPSVPTNSRKRGKIHVKKKTQVGAGEKIWRSSISEWGATKGDKKKNRNLKPFANLRKPRETKPVPPLKIKDLKST